jgi:hypothetical protein
MNALKCAHRTSTVSSCAFCEHRERSCRPSLLTPLIRRFGLPVYVSPDPQNPRGRPNPSQGQRHHRPAPAGPLQTIGQDRHQRRRHQNRRHQPIIHEPLPKRPHFSLPSSLPPFPMKEGLGNSNEGMPWLASTARPSHPPHPRRAKTRPYPSEHRSLPLHPFLLLSLP